MPQTQLAGAWVDAWNRHDVDGVLALFTDDVVYEDVTAGTVTHGLEEARQFFAGALTGVPDLHFQLVSAVVGAERGAMEWVMTGTNTGDTPEMPATRKAFTMRGA